MFNDSYRRRLAVTLGRGIIAACAVAALCPRASAQSYFDQIDYTKLKSRLGAATPIGSGGVISQVEAANASNAYYIDTNIGEFTAASDPLGAALNLTDGSGLQNNGISGHATNTVGSNYFGNTLSIAPGANDVTIYEANNWLSNVIKYNSNSPPTPQNFRVQNYSWIAEAQTTPPHDPTVPALGSTSADISALRRFDYLIETGDMTAVAGANNAGATLTAHPRLLVSSYNAIVVGRSDGKHSRGQVYDFGYGGGRYKPDLVTPGNFTSQSTARVSSAAAMLHQTAAGTDAARSEVMKAILMAGATKSEFANWVDSNTGLVNPWDHTPTRPLDDVFGAGELNIYNSYLSQLGGKQSGSQSAPAASVGSYGWDYQDHKSDSSVGDIYYNFTVPAGSTANELSIILAWNVNVTDTNSSPAIFSPQETLQNLDLQFYDSSSTFLGTLLDQSISTIDNVEHIYETNLGPGTYTLKVTGAANWDYGLAWRMSTAFNSSSADFDENGLVDGADFLVWQQNNGKLLMATHAQGDANGDGSVDVDDLAILTAAGVSPPPMAAPSVGGSAAGSSVGGLHSVPEPVSALLLVAGGMMVAGRIRRWKQCG